MKLDDPWVRAALDAADEAVAQGAYDRVADALTPLPLELFVLLYFEFAAEWPHLSAWLPRLPSAADQERWTGLSGWPAMHAAAVFVGDVLAKFGRDARDAKVLDYGCGWGRMLRLLYARVRMSGIYGVDPWPPSLELVQDAPGSVAQVDYLPERLPFDEKFDLIYAFSVLTHISPNAQRAVLSAMRKHIAADGLVALTVRPGSYWEKVDWPGPDERAALLDRHRSAGFAYIPNPPTPDGHTPDYGRASITLEHIRREWREWSVDGVQWRAADPFQLSVYLRPA
ncbi:class I SAM-dependent methyltransferase [Terricaulis sp.]|uniref:class I SAM-dependent methyltransferase n=1 Tax=Terricaulis sp. TaxID=2768686 RepID=UPI00378492C4